MLRGPRKYKLSGAQIGALIIGAIAVLCAAIGQPYAAAVFVFVSLAFLFGGQPGSNS